MNTIAFRRIANIAGLLLVLVMNYLANALPIAGKTTGELSDLYPNLFVPAGFTFAIWGVIYLLLIGFAVYQARKRNDSVVSKIGWLFVVNCLANASWILVWHHQMVFLSFLVMLVILFSLISIYLRLDIGRADVKGGQFWLVHVPFSVYLGWITVATIANVTTLLVDLDWDGAGISEQTWAMVMVIAAVVIGLLVLYRRMDWAYALVLIWAFFGIYSKVSHFVEPLSLSITTLVSIGVLLGGIALAFWKRSRV